MAIDSSLFAADIPAAAYTAGDIIPLGIISGPATVRSGRGAAILKNIFVGELSAGTVSWRVHVKNSDWVDDVQNISAAMTVATSLDEKSGLNQKGHDCVLTPNSSWEVYAEALVSATTTSASSIFALIDVDYPSVSAIQDPNALVGIPCSINFDRASVPANAFGSAMSATWYVENVDYFKAGYEYCLDHVEMFNGTAIGFVAFANAAGMGGLQRIIPISNSTSGIRYSIKYASKLSKGPMDVKLMLFGSTASVSMCHDFVKRRVA